MNNNFNNWKKINNITKKISMVKKKRWMLGFLLTTIFLAFLIPGGYFLSKQIADTFTIKNIRSATGKNTGDGNKDNGNKDNGNKDNGNKDNGNKGDEEDGINDNLKPPTEVTRDITLNGQFVPIQTNRIQTESFRIKELRHLIENDLVNFFKTDMFFKSKNINYINAYLPIDLSFIQQDSDHKEIVLENLQINEGMRSYKIKFIFNLKIINTHLFYQRYLTEYNFQSAEIDNFNTEMGYLPIKWLYLNQPPTGALLYKKVDDALEKFFKDHSHEFTGLFIETELRTARLGIEFDQQENLRTLINNSEDEIDINQFYLYFKAKKDSNIQSFELLNKVDKDYNSGFNIVTKLSPVYTTLNFVREILGLSFEIPEIRSSFDNNCAIRFAIESKIHDKVKELYEQGTRLVDDINILNWSENMYDCKIKDNSKNQVGGVSEISVNNDRLIYETAIYRYDIKFLSESYPKFIFNISGYLKIIK